MKRFLSLLAISALSALSVLPGTTVWSQSGDSAGLAARGDRGGNVPPEKELVDRWAEKLTSDISQDAADARERLEAGNAETFPIVEALLSHEKATVRRAAVNVAFQRPDVARFVVRLSGLLRDPDLGIRWETASALGKTGAAGAGAAAELVQSMLDPGLRNQTAAKWAVAALGEAAWPALIDSLREPATVLAARAFDMISGPGIQIQGGDACATGALLQALHKSPEPAVRRQAARVLRRLKLLGAATEAALLRVALDDEAAEVRAAAAEALVETPAERHEDIVRSLREGRHDPDPKARAAIVEALKKLGAGEGDLK